MDREDTRKQAKRNLDEAFSFIVFTLKPDEGVGHADIAIHVDDIDTTVAALMGTVEVLLQRKEKLDADRKVQAGLN